MEDMENMKLGHRDIDDTSVEVMLRALISQEIDKQKVKRLVFFPIPSTNHIAGRDIRNSSTAVDRGRASSIGIGASRWFQSSE